MKIELVINSKAFEFDITPDTTVVEALRQVGFFGSKDAKCQAGECGACSVLMDGKLVNSCQILAVQAAGHQITTIEAIGEMPNQGWKSTTGLDVIQQAFINTVTVHLQWYWLRDYYSIKTKSQPGRK
jgi:aerobic-type carbon monoxide dehydrogenase small subunit (CoxS/CutS family)